MGRAWRAAQVRRRSGEGFALVPNPKENEEECHGQHGSRKTPLMHQWWPPAPCDDEGVVTSTGAKEDRGRRGRAW